MIQVNGLPLLIVQLHYWQQFPMLRTCRFQLIVSKARYLSAFDNLSKLKLVFKDCHYLELVLPEFLNRSPKLESLIIDHVDFGCGVHTNDRNWSQPKKVPISLVSSLKNITLRGVRGAPEEMKMGQYLLVVGKVLEPVTVSITNDRICFLCMQQRSIYSRHFVPFKRVQRLV